MLDLSREPETGITKPHQHLIEIDETRKMCVRKYAGSSGYMKMAARRPGAAGPFIDEQFVRFKNLGKGQGSPLARIEEL
jgi:hypothetical protein